MTCEATGCHEDVFAACNCTNCNGNSPLLCFKHFYDEDACGLVTGRVKSQSEPTVQRLTLSLYLEPQARSLTDRDWEKNAHNTGLWTKGMSSAYIRVKEVRGQVPGTTCNGVRAKSAINN